MTTGVCAYQKQHNTHSILSAMIVRLHLQLYFDPESSVQMLLVESLGQGQIHLRALNRQRQCRVHPAKL